MDAFLEFLLLLVAAIGVMIFMIKKPNRKPFVHKPVSTIFDLNQYLKGDWTCQYLNQITGDSKIEEVGFGEGGRYHVDGETVPVYIIKEIVFNDENSELRWVKMDYALKSRHSVETLNIHEGMMTGSDSLGFEVKYEKIVSF